MRARFVPRSFLLAAVLLTGPAVHAAPVQDGLTRAEDTSVAAVAAGFALDADVEPPAVPFDSVTAGLDAGVMGDFACTSDCGGCGHCDRCLPTSRISHGPLYLPWLNRFLGFDADWDPASRNWTVSAGAMMLTGPQLGNHVLAQEPLGTEFLNAADNDLGFASGPVVSFLWYGTYCDVEARYFAIDRWADQNPPKEYPAEDSFSTITYASALRSFELNLRRNHTEWLTWLTGFRTVQVDDAVYFLEEYGGQTARQYTTTTRNRLYGWQLGVDAILWEYNRLRVEGVAKGGVYGNDRNLTGSGKEGVSSTTVSYSVTQLGFLGELGLTAAYRLNPCWTLRGGYQLFWVDGIATAAGQASNVNIKLHSTNPYTDNLPTGLQGSTTNFYHGAMVALEYTWCCRRGS
ncbi:MAG: BBP7 family outer membrane beta-barrel protein [Planctomycetota bacterium]|nr:BBP7 family outer membrane beta-barrel protein [Planctomycetota bacterium]